jgi:SPP1 family predicted phage head-tail adaptor
MPRGYGAGPMRNRVDVQTAVTTSDTFSQDTQVWTSISTHWAEITFVSGRFIQNALQNKEEITHLIRMRWFPGLTPAMRILYEDRVFSIIYINNVDEKNREYRLQCQEIVSNT